MPRRSQPPQPPHPERSKEAVGWRLKAAREVIGLDQKRICAELNVAQNTWNQWEKGTRMADHLAMARLWDKFGIDLNYVFMGRTDSLPLELGSKIRHRLVEIEYATTYRPDDITAAAAGRLRTKTEHEADQPKAK